MSPEADPLPIRVSHRAKSNSANLASIGGGGPRSLTRDMALQRPGQAVVARFGGAAARFKLVVPLALLAGCSGYHLWDNTYNTQGKLPSAPAPAPIYAYGYPKSPPVLDAAGLQDLVSKFRHSVIVLDFWASWSRQNRDELSMLSRLQDDLQGDGFQVIACNLDPADKWSTQTVPILHGAGSNFPCVVVTESARPAIKAWLSPQWSYDLPARFILNRSGRVSAQALGATSIDSLEQQVRQLVRAGPGGEGENLAGGEIALRLKYINVASGEGTSLGEETGDRADLAGLADRAAALFTNRIDRAGNPRIAVASFPSHSARTSVGPLGLAAAEELEAALKHRGYFDVVGPRRTDRMIAGIGQSALSIEYESAALQGRLPVDYVVIGWLRGDGGKLDTDDALAGEPVERP